MAAPWTAREAEQLEVLLRAKLDELEARFKRERTPEATNAFRRALNLFTGFVLHRNVPSDEKLEWIKHA